MAWDAGVEPGAKAFASPSIIIWHGLIWDRPGWWPEMQASVGAKALVPPQRDEVKKARS